MAGNTMGSNILTQVLAFFADAQTEMGVVCVECGTYTKIVPVAQEYDHGCGLCFDFDEIDDRLRLAPANAKVWFVHNHPDPDKIEPSGIDIQEAGFTFRRNRDLIARRHLRYAEAVYCAGVVREFFIAE